MGDVGVPELLILFALTIVVLGPGIFARAGAALARRISALRRAGGHDAGPSTAPLAGEAQRATASRQE